MNVTAGIGPGTFPGVGFVGGVYRARRSLDAIRSIETEIDARQATGPVFAKGSSSHVESRVEASDAINGPALTPRDVISAMVG